MIVWTQRVDEHTLGVITLVTATHELLQIACLAGWSQYALRYFGRYQDRGEGSRFYRTENAVLLVSVLAQSIIAVALLFVIAPHSGRGLLVATVGYVITRTLNLYIGSVPAFITISGSIRSSRSLVHPPDSSLAWP